MPSKMNAALAQITQLAASANEVARQRLMTALHKLASSMESSKDTTRRFGHMTLQPAAIKIGIDLGIFKHLVEVGGVVTARELSLQTDSDYQLMTRILRYLSTINAVDEVSQEKYTANHVTKNLAEKVTEAGINHYFGTVGPQYLALPLFLRKTSYQNPINELHTAFQDAWETPLHAFAWFGEHPEHLVPFNDYMALRREPQLSWLSVYPIGEEVQDINPQRPLYVNVGGGVGHQCAQFKERYPDLPGRVILQDLPHSIAEALKTPGVENLVHNFFDPQPIKGAKFYYMRGVLHNHPPHKVQKLLENTKSAMAPDSILLIDEMILPDVGVNANAAAIDMTMMTAFAAMERTEAQWRETLNDAGLEIVRVHTYNPLYYESVMDVRLLKNGK